MGNSNRPMTDGQLEEKFRDLANRVIAPERAGQIVQKCWEFERLADCRELIELTLAA